MTSNGYHFKGQGRLTADKFRKPSTEFVGGFKLTYRPVSELREGLSGTSQMGFNPATGKVDQMGNPIKYPAGRFQTDVVVVEDAQSGEIMDTVWTQAEAHRIVKTILAKRVPRPDPIKVSR